MPDQWTGASTSISRPPADEKEKEVEKTDDEKAADAKLEETAGAYDKFWGQFGKTLKMGVIEVRVFAVCESSGSGYTLHCVGMLWNADYDERSEHVGCFHNTLNFGSKNAHLLPAPHGEA